MAHAQYLRKSWIANVSVSVKIGQLSSFPSEYLNSCEHIYTVYNNDNCIGKYLDLKKAFDIVNHNILLDKMCHYGTRGLVHKWFTSYLNSKKQYTFMENHCLMMQN